MPASKFIICASCRELVEVVDRIVGEHARGDASCPGAGARHVGSVASVEVQGAPGVQILGVKPVRCGDCGQRHALEVTALVHRGAIARASLN